MSQPLTRDQLQNTIAVMVKQTELFSETVHKYAQDLNQADLEKLTITLRVAQKSIPNLKPEEQHTLQKSLKRYFDGKKRVYQKTQQAWVAYHEQKYEAQESLLEEALLQQIQWMRRPHK